MTEDFVKFPHTPHLVWLGNQSPRADKVLPPSEVADLLSDAVVVEEKVDGANLGLSVGPDGLVRAQNRGNWLKRGSHAQFDAFWAWLDQWQTDLSETLGDHLMLFGEWCLAVHSVRYNALPDWFLGFDVYDRSTGRFWDVLRRDALINDLGLAGVPRLAKGRFSVAELRNMLSQPSKLGGDSLEGIYIRADENGWLKARAKIVRFEFVQTIDEHWSRGPIKRNTVCSTQTESRKACAMKKNDTYFLGAEKSSSESLP